LRPVCHATAGVVATARPQGFCESEWPAPAGEIGSGCFEAADVIRVRRGHVSVPTAGSVLPGGNTTEVRWDTPADVDVPSVVVPFSADDGASWNLMARDLPNTGSYLWTVPTTATDRAGIAVVTMSFGEGGRRCQRAIRHLICARRGEREREVRPPGSCSQSGPRSRGELQSRQCRAGEARRVRRERPPSDGAPGGLAGRRPAPGHAEGSGKTRSWSLPRELDPR
jgi:hypothetical protein